MGPRTPGKKPGRGELLVLLLSVMILSGCLYSEERITINADGSGTIEAHVKIHPGTVRVIDAMMGGVINAFQAMV